MNSPMLIRLLLVAACTPASARPDASRPSRSNVARRSYPAPTAPLHLRGGGALATPFTPLELAEAAAGLMYTTQILLMPHRWVVATLYLDATNPDVLALVGLLGVILAGARLCLAYMRIRQTGPEQRREIDVVSAACWGMCVAWTLWFQRYQTGPGFLANTAINSAFAAAFAIRASIAGDRSWF